MPFPRQPFKSKDTGDPSQPETSGGPVRGAEEATENPLDALARDVFATSGPSQDNDGEQAASPGSSEEGEASTRHPLGSASSDRGEGEAAHGSPERSSPPLSQAHIDYHSKPEHQLTTPEDQLTTETQESTENLADSPEASPNLLNVIEDIFQKKVVGDPLVQSLLELHGAVDVRKLAAELAKFATDIGASKHRN